MVGQDILPCGAEIDPVAGVECCVVFGEGGLIEGVGVHVPLVLWGVGVGEPRNEDLADHGLAGPEEDGSLGRRGGVPKMPDMVHSFAEQAGPGRGERGAGSCGE